MQRLISNHVRSNVVGYIALFLVLRRHCVALDGPLPARTRSGRRTSSTARSRPTDIGATRSERQDRRPTGKERRLSLGASSSNTIADGGIQGVDLKNDTLTGTQIDESGLRHGAERRPARRPGLKRPHPGGGLAAGGFATVPEALDGFFDARWLIRPSEVGGAFGVSYFCPQDANNNGQVMFQNEDSTPVRLFADHGGADPSFIGDLPNNIGARGEQAAASGDYITFQARYPDARVATVHVFSQHNPAANNCYAEAQALLTTGQSGQG